jgi:hypothetical protein
VSDDERDNLLCHLYQLVYGDLGLCGCGWPAEAITTIHELLTAMAWTGSGEAWQKRRATTRRLLPTPAVEHLVLSMLDHAKLIDHGTSIASSWLTERGKWLLWAVEQVGGIEGLDGQLDEAGYPHPWDPAAKQAQPCTDACWALPDDWKPAGPPGQPQPVTVAAGPAACAHCLYGAPHNHEEQR